MPAKLINLITSPDPAVRNQSLDAFCRAASLAGVAGRMQRTRSVPPAQRESLRTRPRPVLPLRHPPVSSALQARASHTRSLDSVSTATRICSQRRFEEAIATFLKVQTSDGAIRPHFQRAGGGVLPAGDSDAGRPGAPQRALGARQSVDVPHGPSGRSSAAPPAGTAAAAATTAPIRSCANARRCAWTSRTAAGATFSSSAWIIPRARRC